VRETGFDELLAGTAAVPDPGTAPDDLAALPYSSGTTGLAKGVMLTHRNLVANLLQMQPLGRVHARARLLAVLPLFHIYGMTGIMNQGLRMRALVVTMPRFDLAGFLAAVAEHRIDHLYVAPPIALALAKSPLVDSYDLSSVEVVMSAAAPLDAELGRAVARRLGATVIQGYGLTESSPCTHGIPADRPGIDLGSIGVPMASVEARVVDPATGEDVRPGERGELWCRGPNIMRGYLNNPAATRAAVDDEGFLHTGDIVTVDGDGVFRVVDRLKELIKYKGYQVAPAELEAVLLTHEGVADAAVIGVRDAEGEEVPKAFVVRRDNHAALDAEDLMAFVAARVAPHKKVRRLEFVDAVPKSAAGKILRKVLRDREAALASPRRERNAPPRATMRSIVPCDGGRRDVVDGPRLSGPARGWLRHLHRKATTPDDWSSAGRPAAWWDDRSTPPVLSFPRFDLSESSYAVPMMADVTPAWREVYVEIMDGLLARHTTHWAAIDWLTQIGHDPDRVNYPEELVRLWIPEHLAGRYDMPGWTANGVEPWGLAPDPVGAEGNLFFKGWFNLMLGFHGYVSRARRWNEPFLVTGLDDRSFSWTHDGINALLARQWTERPEGPHCENTKIWPYCLSAAGLGLLMHDHLTGGGTTGSTTGGWRSPGSGSSVSPRAAGSSGCALPRPARGLHAPRGPDGGALGGDLHAAAGAGAGRDPRPHGRRQDRLERSGAARAVAARSAVPAAGCRARPGVRRRDHPRPPVGVRRHQDLRGALRTTTRSRCSASPRRPPPSASARSGRPVSTGTSTPDRLRPGRSVRRPRRSGPGVRPRP
jgi:Acyl-CoA synthetases (AMP-forming)/AMP-acid ligases II